MSNSTNGQEIEREPNDIDRLMKKKEVVGWGVMKKKKKNVGYNWSLKKKEEEKTSPLKWAHSPIRKWIRTNLSIWAHLSTESAQSTRSWSPKIKPKFQINGPILLNTALRARVTVKYMTMMMMIYIDDDMIHELGFASFRDEEQQCRWFWSVLPNTCQSWRYFGLSLLMRAFHSVLFYSSPFFSSECFISAPRPWSWVHTMRSSYFRLSISAPPWGHSSKWWRQRGSWGHTIRLLSLSLDTLFLSL